MVDCTCDSKGPLPRQPELCYGRSQSSAYNGTEQWNVAVALEVLNSCLYVAGTLELRLISCRANGRFVRERLG